MVKVVILAAGKGTRMNSDLPKVLVPLKGQPMLSFLLRAVEASGVDARPLLVVSPANQAQIVNGLKNYNFETVVQAQQLGTGHALKCAVEHMSDQVGRVLVFNGDHPFITSQTIKKLAEFEAGIAMLSVKLEDFNDWRQIFSSWGKIIKTGDQVKEIIELKDADVATQAITEVNPAMYSFDFAWLKANISKLKDQNAQQEFYLTDLIKLAFEQQQTIISLPIKPEEAIGINSKEELAIAEGLI